MIPNGYLKVNRRLSEQELARIRNIWSEYTAAIYRGGHQAMVLDQGVEFVPFAVQSLPDAFCKYCGVANLTTSAWCSQCGAPLLRAQ